jgi:hypothetical protein
MNLAAFFIYLQHVTFAKATPFSHNKVQRTMNNPSAVQQTLQTKLLFHGLHSVVL